MTTDPRPDFVPNSHSSEYRAWKHMRQRCTMPTHEGYHLYGGRGINVCERWATFANFYEDMGPRPSSRHSLDRINNDGNYEPSNCRWALPAEQMYNRRCTIRVEGKTIQEWAEHFGVTYERMRHRLRRSKMSLEDALKPPPPPKQTICGVRPLKSGRFLARVKSQNKYRYLGTFDTAEAAAQRVAVAREELRKTA